MFRQLAATAILLSCVGLTRAEIIDGYSAARNDRFTPGTFPGNTPPTNNATFFLPPPTYDFSGVGWVSGPNGSGTKQVAMLSPTHFVFATHFPLGINTTVAFRAKDGTYVTRTVAQETQISGSDVSIGKLNAPLPTGATGISSYPVAFGAESAFVGLNEYMFGQHGQVGRNVVGLFQTASIAGANTRLALSDFDPNINFDGFGFATPNPPTDEFLATVGDSGSPSFLFQGSTLSLLGHHSAALGANADQGTADAFYSFYVAAMASNLAIDGVVLQTFAVPEPSSLALCGVAGGVGLWLRRRRTAA